MFVPVPLQVDYAASPIEPLFDARDVADWEVRLRCDLWQDTLQARDVDADVFRRSQEFGGWFQRISVPGTYLTTTSDHTRATVLGGNPLQNLYGRLSDADGSILRPRSKWCYLEPHMPDARGKTVFEAGSNCGFFAFEFVKAGAARVTGCDIIKPSVDSAIYMAGAMSCSNTTQFICDDFTRSDEILAHDVVFMSEVLTHSPCPVSTLYTSTLLANEMLIIDDYFEREDGPLDFYIATAPEGPSFGGLQPGQFVFLAASVSERLLLKTLRIAGVLPQHVRRLHDPIEPRHSLIIADTRGARERRQNELWHPYLRSMIGAERQAVG